MTRILPTETQQTTIQQSVALEPTASTKPLNWFRIALQLRGSILVIILPRVLLFGSFGVLVSILHSFELPSLDILGKVTDNFACNFVLGLLLVFRTNTAYDRFWEGRKAWGILTISVRNLAREIQLTVAAEQTQKTAVLRLLSAFVIATKLHLRQQSITTELDTLVSPQALAKLSQVNNAPLEIALWIGAYLQQQYQHGHVELRQRIAMIGLLNSMVEGLTSCERILRTPIPLAYALYLKRVILIYCTLLPFNLVGTLQWWTGFTIAVVSFILLGVEEIGNQIEDPFSDDPNDLPLDDICQRILNNVESVIAFAPENSWEDYLLIAPAMLNPATADPSLLNSE